MRSFVSFNPDQVLGLVVYSSIVGTGLAPVRPWEVRIDRMGLERTCTRSRTGTSSPYDTSFRDMSFRDMSFHGMKVFPI